MRHPPNETPMMPFPDNEPAKEYAYVVFDTETSDLFDFSKPADAPGQPRLAALSMIWTTPGLAVTREEMLYIKPTGWKMGAGATAVNGLTDDFLERNGIPIEQALDLYEEAIREGRAFIAFNAQFDTKVMRAELRRAGREDHFESTPNICVMRKSIGVCKIPKKTGNGYKFPKLAEALQHFRIPQSGAHTASGDAQGALEIARALMQIGIDMTPEVHKAKVRPIDEAQPAKAKKANPLSDDEIPY